MNARVFWMAFGIGAVESWLAGILTGGLAVGYALVALSIWTIVAKVGGEGLANQTWLIVTLSAVAHGLLFAALVTFARLLFPRLRENQLGKTIFLVAAAVYGILIAFAFPQTP
jgi:hypothetical protein